MLSGGMGPSPKGHKMNVPVILLGPGTVPARFDAGAYENRRTFQDERLLTHHLDQKYGHVDDNDQHRDVGKCVGRRVASDNGQRFPISDLRFCFTGVSWRDAPCPLGNPGKHAASSHRQ